MQGADHEGAADGTSRSHPVVLADLLGAAVRVGTVRLGDVSGVFVDASGTRVIGLEVSGVGGPRRFLPWVAARLAAGTVGVESALFLVDDGPSYERLGARAVRDRHGLDGVLASADGSLEHPVVSTALTTGITE